MPPFAPSFDEIYEAHFGFMWRALGRLGVPVEQVEDATQDAFLVVHRRLGDFEGRSSLKTWLYGIALRVARDYRRRLQRKGGLEPLPRDLAAKDSSPLDRTALAEAAQLMYRLLAGLDDDKREVFVLVELEQMTVPEIAELLGGNVNTIHSRLRAARLAFNKAVARLDVQRKGREPWTS